MCPYCGQNAPVVYRGVTAYCSACQRKRPPLIAPSVSYAGKPSKVGGTVAGIAGWLVLVFGASAAIGLGLLGSLFNTTVALAVGLPIGLVTLAVSLTLLLSGRKLRKDGAQAQKDMRRRALESFAANRGGVVTATDAAAALDIPVHEADAHLEELARTVPEQVTVELDDQGGIHYAFQRFLAMRGAQKPRTEARVGQPAMRFAGDGSAEEEADAEAEAHAARGRR